MTRMRLSIAMGLSLLLASLLAGAASQAETEQSGVLRVTFEGSFAPHSLPRRRLAPVTVDVRGAISTSDGSHPPPLRRIEVAINSGGRLSSVGLPSCSSGRLQSTSTEAALKACRPALVGRGRFQAEVSFQALEHTTAKGEILIFNGVRKGRSTLLLHLYTASPVRATLVLPLQISHRRQGNFGTFLAGTMPKLAGGLGSITELSMEIGRRYTYRGKRRSYVSASCAAPAGFDTIPFTFARGTFLFEGAKSFHTALTRDCRVR